MSTIASAAVPPSLGLSSVSPLLIPPNIQFLNSISDWRTTWSHIVSGRFSASPLGGLFCYDRENGIAAFYSIDEGGGIQLVNEFEERPLWTHVVAGVFG